MLTSWPSVALIAMGMKELTSLAIIAATRLAIATHSKFLLGEITVFRSIRIPAAATRSARSTMVEAAHAAMSTPARMFSPSDAALPTLASNRSPQGSSCKGRTILNLSQPDSDVQEP